MQKPDIVKEWIKYAETDLASANHLLGMHPIPIEIICYHCAQSAEKALKAFLIAKDVEPPRTHDLRFKQIVQQARPRLPTTGASLH